MDSFQTGIRVGKIATGEAKSTKKKTQRHKGGAARAKKLDAKKRKTIAKKAAKARWKK